MDAVADDEPAPLEVLAGYAAEGRPWVIGDHSVHPIGYIFVNIIDGGGQIV